MRKKGKAHIDERLERESVKRECIAVDTDLAKESISEWNTQCTLDESLFEPARE